MSATKRSRLRQADARGLFSADEKGRVFAKWAETNPRFLEAGLAHQRRRAFLETLATLRRQLNITQQQVADRMESTQPAVARLEAGRGDPRVSTLERYAAALGLRMEFNVSRYGAAIVGTRERMWPALERGLSPEPEHKARSIGAVVAEVGLERERGRVEVVCNKWSLPSGLPIWLDDKGARTAIKRDEALQPTVDEFVEKVTAPDDSSRDEHDDSVAQYTPGRVAEAVS